MPCFAHQQRAGYTSSPGLWATSGLADQVPHRWILRPTSGWLAPSCRWPPWRPPPWVGGRLPCGAGHRCPPALQHADGLSDHPLISPHGNVPGGRFLSCEALAGVGRESSEVGVSVGQPRAIYLLSLPCFSFGGPPCAQSLRRGLRRSRGRASQVGSEARVRPQASAQLSLSPPARFFWCHDGKQRGRSVPSSGRAEPAWRVMGERAGMKAERPESRSSAAARSRVIPGRLLHVSGPPPRPPL